MKNIIIKGARVHNLKGIDITIPKNKLIVATGVSGSGKSSLVFDIIFEEGRKQYLQSIGILSGITDEDKFDSVSGLGPTIAVQQNIIRQSNPRSTVGSRSGILNLLAVLYSGAGRMSCSLCGSPTDENNTCNKCENCEERLEATYFSYNSPNGMCTKCSGRGAYFAINMKRLVPEKSTTVRQMFATAGVTPGYAKLLKRRFGDHIKSPFAAVPDAVQMEILYGHFANNDSRRLSYCLTKAFQARLARGEDLSDLYTSSVCSECHGFRIGPEARRVFLNEKHIGDLGKMTIAEIQDFAEVLLKQKTLRPFGKNLLTEILRKTRSLLQMRLGYLSLYREMPTLSGGEIQRLFLHSHLDAQMDSLIYILDEPTAGLHESEKARLLESIRNLKDAGNTVIVVEHDRNTIEMAEHIIDIGPKAGIEGGRINYQGNLAGLLKSKKSLTGQYLSGKIPMPARTTGNPELSKEAPHLTIRNARTNNLKDVTVSVPLAALVGIAGVSGSGKSSLISDTLIPLLKGHFNNPGETDGTEIEDPEMDHEADPVVIQTIADRLEGIEHISGYAEVTQAPIGRHMNSNAMSYTGIWDKIRKLFAKQPAAIQKNLSAGHFSFNSKGACSVCGGSGRETVWLGGEIKIHNACAGCLGKRYNADALAVRCKDKNIFDILEMSISEAVTFFEDNQTILPALRILDRIGMGYIKLGQPTPTLSGGEAQRVKLAKEIGRRRKGNILYVLDEPTTGLSLYDTARLLELLDELVAQGNSVVVIEHDPEILSACDWIIELGPAGGAEGGKIIAEDTPRRLSKISGSKTGKFLNRDLNKKTKRRST